MILPSQLASAKGSQDVWTIPCLVPRCTASFQAFSVNAFAPNPPPRLAPYLNAWARHCYHLLLREERDGGLSPIKQKFQNCLHHSKWHGPRSLFLSQRESVGKTDELYSKAKHGQKERPNLGHPNTNGQSAVYFFTVPWLLQAVNISCTSYNV